MTVTTDVEGYAEIIEIIRTEGGYPMHEQFGTACAGSYGDFMGALYLGWLNDDQAREALAEFRNVADERTYYDEWDEPHLRPVEEVLDISTIERTWMVPVRGGGWEQDGGANAVPATLVHFAWRWGDPQL